MSDDKLPHLHGGPLGLDHEDGEPNEPPTTDYDVMKAIAVGCEQHHMPSVDAARRVLTNLAAAPPGTLAEVFNVLIDGGCFTDESVEGEIQDGEPVPAETELVVPYTNSGHGHVWARPDGMKARCGGPGMCSDCKAEQELFRLASNR